MGVSQETCYLLKSLWKANNGDFYLCLAAEVTLIDWFALWSGQFDAPRFSARYLKQNRKTCTVLGFASSQMHNINWIWISLFTETVLNLYNKRQKDWRFQFDKTMNVDCIRHQFICFPISKCNFKGYLKGSESTGVLYLLNLIWDNLQISGSENPERHQAGWWSGNVVGDKPV